MVTASSCNEYENYTLDYKLSPLLPREFILIPVLMRQRQVISEFNAKTMWSDLVSETNTQNNQLLILQMYMHTCTPFHEKTTADLGPQASRNFLTGPLYTQEPRNY